MDAPFTNDEYEKLLFVDACLRAHQFSRFNEEDVLLLQKKGLLAKFGMGAEITPKGHKALFDLREGS